MELNENLSLGDMAGMGEVSLPTETSVGSGDIPAGKGKAEEEYKKKRNKKKQKEMKNIVSFESFDENKLVKEAVSKNTKVYCIATPMPVSMLIEELEELFGDDYRHIVTEFEDDEGYESVLVFNLTKKDIQLIEDSIGDVLIWEYSIKKGKLITESLNESSVEDLHFETDPKKAEDMKIAIGRSQGEVTRSKQIEGGEYALKRFRKEIKYGNGKDLGVFLPGSYAAATSKLGDGPHKKAVKKVKWNRKKYDQWVEDMASNDGWKNAFDMAQNAKNEPGLLQWAKKEFRGEDVMQRIQWDIEAYAESKQETLSHLKSIVEETVYDEETNDEIFDSETYYTISKLLSIARKSKECKRLYKGDYNFGKGLKLAERLKKEFPQLKFRCRVARSAWNYGGNLVLFIDLRAGSSYKHDLFKFNSANSTRQPNYSFSPIFNGTKKVSTGKVENEWSMGVIHGSYQSISNYDKFMDDVVGVFKDYERVNGKKFDVKDIKATFKANDKILTEWKRLKETKIAKQYDIASNNARKVSRYIKLKMPYIKTSQKTVYYMTDEPREFRHPDEYGSSAYDKMDSKEYIKYEEAQGKISDMIEAFCKKHNFKFTWAANY